MIVCSISGICDTTGAARGVGKYWQPGRGFPKVSLAAVDRSLPSFCCCPAVRVPQGRPRIQAMLEQVFQFIE